MKRMWAVAIVAGLVALPANAADLDLTVQSGGSSDVTAGAGDTVNYAVFGLLSNSDQNEGLALVGFDLSFDGGDLAQANVPAGPPMDNFVRDLGITNPAGFGGTIIAGDLKQVGGAQNTIKNVYGCTLDTDCPGDSNICDVGFCSQSASFPVGLVITGVAWPPGGEVLVTGSLTIPGDAVDGAVYTLNLADAFANVIQQGETGNQPHGFWRTEKVLSFTVTPLTITVAGGTCSFAAASPMNCAIDAGQPHDVGNAAECGGVAGLCGWESVDVDLVCSGAAVPSSDAADYTVTDGSATISSVSVVGNTATINFTAPLTPGEWTCVALADEAANKFCAGYLPGDVSEDGTTGPPDILAVIDSLNGVIPRPDYSVDVDRSGAAGPPDILRVIDLLNGAGQFTVWFGETIGACPSAP